MASRTLPILISIGLITLFGTESEAADTKYAGEFLSLGVGARSLGMGSAFVAIVDDASAGYWNPAGLPALKRREVMLMHSERFGGVVKYDVAGLVLPLQENGGFEISLIRVGVDDIKYTVLADPQKALSASNRPQVSKIVGNADYALYLSYGRYLRFGPFGRPHVHREASMPSRLSLGGSIKLIRRSIGDNTATGFGADLGVLYTTPWGLTIGANLRDVTLTTISWDTGAKDQVGISLEVGAAWTRSIAPLRSKVVASVASGRLGEAAEDDHRSLTAGLEYWYRDVVALRVGSERERLTAGAGFRLYDTVGIDYAFLQHEDLDNTHRVSASVRF